MVAKVHRLAEQQDYDSFVFHSWEQVHTHTHTHPSPLPFTALHRPFHRLSPWFRRRASRSSASPSWPAALRPLGAIAVVPQLKSSARSWSRWWSRWWFPVCSRAGGRNAQLRLTQPWVRSRLVDNDQFRFGHALKPVKTKTKEIVKSKIQTFAVTKVMGFDPKKMCATTMKFEGSAFQVRHRPHRSRSVISVRAANVDCSSSTMAPITSDCGNARLRRRKR